MTRNILLRNKVHIYSHLICSLGFI